MSDDNFVEFLSSKKFIMDESGYMYKKIGKSWLNCDSGISSYFSQDLYYEIIVSDSNGEDIYAKRFYEFSDFKQIIIKIIREERFKILLDE